MANKKAKGARAKTRALRKGPKVTPNKLLMDYPIGSKVDIKIDWSVKAGRPHRRYHGLTGTVVGKQGNCFVVEVYKLNKKMKVIAGPAHISASRGVKPKKESKVVKA
jgi:large subunit ribosomal protein L21e